MLIYRAQFFFPPSPGLLCQAEETYNKIDNPVVFYEHLLELSYNFKNQFISITPIDAYEMTKYCSSTLLAYTAPSLAVCAISNLVQPGTPCAVTGYDLIISTSLGGSECYSVYKVKWLH